MIREQIEKRSKRRTKECLSKTGEQDTRFLDNKSALAKQIYIKLAERESKERNNKHI